MSDTYEEYGLLLEDGSIWTAPIPALAQHLDMAEVIVSAAESVGIHGVLVKRTITVSSWVEVD